MKYRIAETVHTSFYVFLVMGMLLLFRKDIKAIIWRIKMTRRLKTRKKQIEENRIAKHLNMLMATAVSPHFSANHFCVLSGIVFTVVLIPGLRNYKPHMAVFFALLIGIMPYFFLRIRLESIRHKASFEGEAFVTSLLSKYRISSFDMQRALELLVEDEKVPEICKKLMIPAIMKARMTGDKGEIKEAFDEFHFAVNTNWSRMAVYNIAASFSSGIDVTGALEDIMMQLREARMISEERKRLNSEANRLVMFMVPVSYALSLVLAVKYVGVKPAVLIKNQFFTPQGFALFIGIVFMFLINTAMLKILENKRFDY